MSNACNCCDNYDPELGIQFRILTTSGFKSDYRNPADGKYYSTLKHSDESGVFRIDSVSRSGCPRSPSYSTEWIREPLHSWSDDLTYFDEYSTDDMIADAISCFGEWPDWTLASPGGFGGVSAFRLLANYSLDGEPDDSTCHFQKVQWRMVHRPSITCYLKVWFNSTFTPRAGAPVTTAVAPYTWAPSGSNPCLPDPTKSVADNANIILGQIRDLEIPAEDGTNTITIDKWSYVPGYVPDQSHPGNPQPNGWPDPAWKPTA